MRSTDKDKWLKALEEEHENLVENKVWKPVSKDALSPEAFKHLGL
jgi:hypothetical protein